MILSTFKHKNKINKNLLVIISAWGSRLVSVICYFASIKLLMSSLGASNYSIFVLLISLITWFSLFDLGIGYSLQNAISEKRASKKDYSSLISSTCIFAILLIIFVIFLTYLSSSFISNTYLRQFSIFDEKKSTYFFVNGILLAIISIGSLGFKILYAELKGYWANILQALAAVLGLSLIYLINRQDFFDDKTLGSIFFYNLPIAILSLVIISKYCLASFRQKVFFDKIAFAKIFNNAKKFGLFALLSTLVLGIDYIFISQFLSSNDIVCYNISTKVMSQLLFVYNAVLMAIWPISSEAGHNKQWKVINLYIKRSLSFGFFLIVISGFVLFFFLNDILNLLGKPEYFHVPNIFIAFLCIYLLLRIWTDTFAIILQSLNVFYPFWLYVPLQAIINIAFMFILVPKMGLSGVLLSLILSFILSVSWALPNTYLKFIKKNESI